MLKNGALVNITVQGGECLMLCGFWRHLLVSHRRVLYILFVLELCSSWPSCTSTHLLKINILDVDLVLPRLHPTKEIVLCQHVPNGTVVDWVQLDHIENIHLMHQVAVDYRDTLRGVKHRLLRAPWSFVAENIFVVFCNWLLIFLPFLCCSLLWLIWLDLAGFGLFLMGICWLHVI